MAHVEDIYFPAFNPKSKQCILQQQHLLFSCVGEHPDFSRLCPCRSYMEGQTALCTTCSWRHWWWCDVIVMCTTCLWWWWSWCSISVQLVYDVSDDSMTSLPCAHVFMTSLMMLWRHSCYGKQDIGTRNTQVNFYLQFFGRKSPSPLWRKQSSHSDWKTWKNGKAFSSQGKVREFWTDWKSQGIWDKDYLIFLYIIFSDI